MNSNNLTKQYVIGSLISIVFYTISTILGSVLNVVGIYSTGIDYSTYKSDTPLSSVVVVLILTVINHLFFSWITVKTIGKYAEKNSCLTNKFFVCSSIVVLVYAAFVLPLITSHTAGYLTYIIHAAGIVLFGKSYINKHSTTEIVNPGETQNINAEPTIQRSISFSDFNPSFAGSPGFPDNSSSSDVNESLQKDVINEAILASFENGAEFTNTETDSLTHPADTSPNKRQAVFESIKNQKWLYFLTVAALISCLALTWRVFQLKTEKEQLQISNSELTDSLNNLTADYESLTEKYDAQKRISDDRLKLISKYESDYSNFTSLIEKCRSQSLGYYSHDFMVDNPLVVLKTNQKKTITLYTGYYDSKYKVSVLGGAATVEWDEQSWYNYTTLTITGIEKGISFAVFTVGNRSMTIAIYVE